MNTAQKYILVIVLVCIAALGGYVVGGNHRQKTLDHDFRLLNFGVWATEVKVNVRVLDLLEAKKYKDADDILENMLDVQLASLSGYDQFAAGHPDKDIIAAIDMAKKHREQYPAHKVHPDLAPGVARALNMGGGNMKP